MKFATRYLVPALFSLCAAGCASGPSYEEFSGAIEPPLPLDGRIYFYSTTDTHTDFRLPVTLNGEEVGKVRPNGFFYVDRLTGQYEISVPAAERNLSLALQDGDVIYIKVDARTGLFAGRVELVPVDRSVGERELNSTTYVGKQAVVARH